MQELKEAMKEEKEEEEVTMDKILKRYGVEYTGTGPHDPNGSAEGSTMAIDPYADDPLSSLGFGFEAYWKMLSSLSMIFIILTVLFIPQIVFY